MDGFLFFFSHPKVECRAGIYQSVSVPRDKPVKNLDGKCFIYLCEELSPASSPLEKTRRLFFFFFASGLSSFRFWWDEESSPLKNFSFATSLMATRYDKTIFSLLCLRDFFFFHPPFPLACITSLTKSNCFLPKYTRGRERERTLQRFSKQNAHSRAELELFFSRPT